MDTKKQLRILFRNIKNRLLTKENFNSYHTPLANNFQNIISLFQSSRQGKSSKNDGNDGKKLIIGSYINKAVTEIIPPELQNCSDHNHKLIYAYPYFTSKSRQMAFFQHKPDLKYKKGSFGVKVIDLKEENIVNSQINRLDIVLVPLVAFNQDKFRIGQGGGYYDTYIKKVRQENNLKNQTTFFVGVALQQLRIQSQIEFVRQWDQKLDYIITQKKIYL